MQLPNRSDRDWAEDFEHENGKYQNQCISCHDMFYGHKRRVICKECFHKDAETWARKLYNRFIDQYSRLVTQLRRMKDEQESD